jgi:RNA polymerase sigma-70 factor (ECF subfamily)
MLVLCSMSTEEQKTENATLDLLLGELAAGSTAALEGLYCRTHVAIYGFALSILKNTHDAEDALHDCYLAVADAAAGYRSQGKPMGWLIAITRNLCLQKLRERRRLSDLPQEDWEPYLAGRDGLTPEDRLTIAACMERLSDQERQIVVLHAVAGLKHREIAAALRLPLPTVLSKYNRALKKLKTHLSGGDSNA